MVIREIEVIKRPREDEPVDRVPNFPNFDVRGLHLELLEFKKKRKPGLGDVPSSAQLNIPITTDTQDTDDASSTSSTGDKAQVISPPSETPSKKVKSFEDSEGEEDDDEEDELADALGEDSEDEEEGDEGEDVSEGEEEVSEGDEGEDVSEGEEGVDDVSVASSSGSKATSVSTLVKKTSTAASVAEVSKSFKTAEEVAEDERQEYIWRWRILKKKFPQYEFDEVGNYSDLTKLKTEYDKTLKIIELEENVSDYSRYLTASFFVIEFVGTTWLNIDMTGFAAAQMNAMTRYNRLLIELGERRYNSIFTNLPVEVRLLGLVIVQAGLFYLGKMLADKAGPSTASMIMNFLSGGGEVKTSSLMQGINSNTEMSAPSSTNTAPQRRMRGPTIHAEDVSSTASVSRDGSSKPKTVKRAPPPPEDDDEEEDDENDVEDVDDE